MNRHQNELDFIVANTTDGSNTVLFTEKDKYYIDIHDNLTFLPEGNFIWTSEKSGFNHIYIRGLDGSEFQLTKGNWEVTSFDGVTSKPGLQTIHSLPTIFTEFNSPSLSNPVI